MTSEGIEERLERIEETLRELVKLLEELQRQLREASIEAPLALSIALGLSKPVLEAIEAARRIAPIIAVLEPDEITRAVLQALADCKPSSISEVARKVRVIRGRVARETVAARLRDLEGKGVVVNLGTGKRPKYVLRTCLEEKSAGSGKAT